MNWQNKRAILYRRVSTDEQADRGYSLLDQQDRLQKFCELMHIEVLALFEDDYSAKSFERPGWKKMFEFIRKNKGAANLLLFTNWSRFSRSENMGETYMMIDQLYKIGIEPQAIEQPLDLSIPENRLILAFYVASPMVENMRRSSNIRHGVRRANQSGRWCNNAPFGYNNSRDENNKPVLQINPEKAAIIEEIFLDYLSGEDPKLILPRAIRKGFQLKGHSKFERIITNPLYAGLIRVPAYKDEMEVTIKAIHEPIISEEIFYVVNKKLRQERDPKPKVYDNIMPLRGLLQCNNCGSLLTGGPSKGKSGVKWWYYRCLKCKGENFRMEHADTELKQILSAISLKQKYIDSVISEIDKSMKDIIAERSGESEQLNRDVKSLSEQLNSLEQKYISNKVSFEVYQKYYPDYRAELAQKQLRLEAISIDKESVIELYRKALPKMQNLGFLYEKINQQSKHQLLNLIFIGGLYKIKPGYRTPQLNSLFSIEAAVEAGLRVGDSDKILSLTSNIPLGRLAGNEIEPLLHFILKIAA